VTRLSPFPARLAAIALLAWSTGPVAGVAASQRQGSGKTFTVIMDGTAFAPTALTVRSGDTVVWVNRDLFPHTATSKGGHFDSTQIPVGATWAFVARVKGDFTYVCTLHPSMVGTLRVE
jgi:plastocyanin